VTEGVQPVPSPRRSMRVPARVYVALLAAGMTSAAAISVCEFGTSVATATCAALYGQPTDLGEPRLADRRFRGTRTSQLTQCASGRCEDPGRSLGPKSLSRPRARLEHPHRRRGSQLQFWLQFSVDHGCSRRCTCGADLRRCTWLHVGERRWARLVMRRSSVRFRQAAPPVKSLTCRYSPVTSLGASSGPRPVMIGSPRGARQSPRSPWELAAPMRSRPPPRPDRHPPAGASRCRW